MEAHRLQLVVLMSSVPRELNTLDKSVSSPADNKTMVLQRAMMVLFKVRTLKLGACWNTMSENCSLITQPSSDLVYGFPMGMIMTESSEFTPGNAFRNQSSTKDPARFHLAVENSVKIVCTFLSRYSLSSLSKGIQINHSI